MSSKTDFYLGRGEHATWLGSLQWECSLDDLLAVPPGRLVLTATDEPTYRAGIDDLFTVWEDENVGDAFRRENGWPWPWPTSHRSSWIIAYEPNPGAVFVTVGGGVAWHQLDPHEPRLPDGDDPLGPPDILFWLQHPAALPSVPMPIMGNPDTARSGNDHPELNRLQQNRPPQHKECL